MKKHTTLNIDTDLLEQAREALGTKGSTETIHRALAEVVDHRKRLWLAQYAFPDLTPESLEEMRRARTLDSPDSE